MTIWAPAFLHVIVQGTVKTIHIVGESSDAFPLVRIAASAVIPALSLVVRRPASG